LNEGWQEVAIVQPAVPPDRFLDRIREAKIVKAVRTSRWAAWARADVAISSMWTTALSGKGRWIVPVVGQFEFCYATADRVCSWLYGALAWLTPVHYWPVFVRRKCDHAISKWPTTIAPCRRDRNRV